MKKIRIVRVALLVLTMIVFFPSQIIRAEQSNVTTISYLGETFYVNKDRKTIKYEGLTYRYDAYGNSKDYTVDIVFPNGGEYSYNSDGSNYSKEGHFGKNDNSFYAKNVPSLVNVALMASDLEKVEREKEPTNWPLKIGITIFFILGGLLAFFFPDEMMFIRGGWMFRNAEPTDASIALSKISGALMIICAIIGFIIV